MGQFKNIHLLTDIGEQDLTKMEYAAVEHYRYSGITFKIVEYGKSKVIIQVVQGKNAGGNYFAQKRLIEIVHETYDRFFPGKKIHVHAVPFIESPANKVDEAWISKKMLDTGTKLKDMAADTGIDYTQLSTASKESRPLSQPMKALFYFYFLSKEQGKG